MLRSRLCLKKNFSLFSVYHDLASVSCVGVFLLIVHLPELPVSSTYFLSRIFFLKLLLFLSVLFSNINNWFIKENDDSKKSSKSLLFSQFLTAVQ